MSWLKKYYSVWQILSLTENENREGTNLKIKIKIENITIDASEITIDLNMSNYMPTNLETQRRMPKMYNPWDSTKKTYDRKSKLTNNRE